MNKIELLAPVGNIESLYAAVQMGANAVYFGGNKFSARANASNFDETAIIKAIQYCHAYNVKVYITLNTLIKETEVEEAFKYIEFLYKNGVDALIVQDTGIAYLVKNNFPGFEIHASTQMTVHNSEGAIFLRVLGFKRIVLSRELSIREIKNITQKCNIETEIFIHGALCVCYSGQCLMSSLIGGRSGNRGRCAQPCRQPYSLINKVSGVEKSAYLLSPKDLCTLENIKEIIETGTHSLKIEGRMKRPEYVAGVVDIYRRAIECAYTGSDFDFKKENRKLLQLFNREGFTKGYLFGNPGKDMMSFISPKNTGLQVGIAGKDLNVILNDSISLQDGIRIGNDGFTLTKIIKDGLEVSDAYEGDKVKLIPTNYTNGDVIYKTADNALLKELEKSFKNPYERKINLHLEVEFKVNEALKLSTIFDNKEFFSTGDMIQSPLSKPIAKDRVIESLKKSGETPFRFDDIFFKNFDNGFISISSINALRRELINKIESYIEDKFPGYNLNNDMDISNRNGNFDFVTNTHNNQDNRISSVKRVMPKVMVSITSPEQLRALEETDIDNIIIYLFHRGNLINIEAIKNKNIYLKIPNIIREEFERICNIIESQLINIKGIVTANLGIINRFKNKTQIIGDYKLNIFNSYSLSFYKDFIDGTALSIELNKKELTELAKHSVIPCQVLIYGRAELMVSEYCAIGCVYGGNNGEKSCSRPCDQGEYILKDRKGGEFLVKTDSYCRSYIYNSVPINLIPNLLEVTKTGVSSVRLDFIDEGYEETLDIIQSFSEGKWEKSFINYTRGHFKRGVE